MSDGERMSLSFATMLAGKVVDELAPVCERIEIAGSIRRKKPTIGDVEIVCIPKLVTATNLLGETISRREADEIAYKEAKERVRALALPVWRVERDELKTLYEVAGELLDWLDTFVEDKEQPIWLRQGVEFRTRLGQALKAAERGSDGGA